MCWRLACQLAHEHGGEVRLWVDDWKTLRHVVPGCPQAPAAVRLAGVEVIPWSAIDARVVPAEVVIEAFACTLPPTYVATLTTMSPRPVWICLQYLSAEDWVEGCHRLPSPDPASGCPRLSYFPGFTRRTGGLIREADLFSRRDLAQAPGGRARWLARHAVARMEHEARWVSLFAYPNPALEALLEAWQAGPAPTQLWVPEGAALSQLSTWLGVPSVRAGACLERGALRVRALPFLPMEDYDMLLALCDVNFVRGEDSFVRAQWAARPLVWQAYPQHDAVHRAKLEAFLARYASGLAPAPRSALYALWLAWNGWGNVAAAWRVAEEQVAALADHARRWCDGLAKQDDLAKQLLNCVDATLN